MQTTIYYGLHQMGAPIWGSGNLVRPCLDDVYKVCPGLAESWASNSDFTQWTFKIRDGVFWHDGTPFSAEDARFWLGLLGSGAKQGEKNREPAWYKANAGLGSFQRAEVVDGNKVRITLGNPSPFLPITLGVPFYPMAHARHLAQPRIEQGEVRVAPLDIGLMGTGPFSHVKYEKGVASSVRRFERYWEKDAQGRSLPYLDGMTFAILTDPSAEDAAFRTGKLDGGSPAGSLTKERKATYVRELGDRVWFLERPGTAAVAAASNLGFNLLKPGPWQDVRVRRAISLQIDKEGAIEAFQGGFGLVSTLLNPKNPYTSPDFLTWPGFNPATKTADRARAKQLMVEAGFPDGFTATVNCLRTRPWIDRCQYEQDQLRPLGIELKLDVLDVAPWVLAGKSLTHDLLQVSSGIPTWLPEALEGGYTRYSVSTGAYTKHEDPKVVGVFDRLRATTEVDARIKIWREFERYVLLDQVLVVPTAGQVVVLAYQSYLKGRLVPDEGIMNYLDFATVWLDR
jgi:peptide/nickel transport system substrate-binding protein